VSTILDALRKLQGDRDGMQTPPRDLRTSVLDAKLPPLRTKSRAPRVRPVIAALGGGALVAGALGGFVLWGDREADPFERATAEAEAPVDPLQMAQAEMPYDAPIETVPSEPPPPASAPLVARAAPPEPPPAPTPQYVPPAFDPTEAHPDPAAPPASSPQVFNPSTTFAPVLERARPADASASQPPSFDPGSVPPQQYEKPQVITRTQQGDTTEPAALEAAVARARERLTAREPSPPPRTEPPAPREEPKPEAASVASLPGDGIEFPEVVVQSVLWHPDPLRRQATILIDGQLTTDAREGDLIGGVFIDRIQPGTVELRMGQERRRVDMSQ
jgi:hypothetical protein